MATVARELPESLDTDLAARRLTGAQAQHIALARVVLADPRTLVLDEAAALLDLTSALTPNVRSPRPCQGRTVIAVAHRLQSAYDADHIAVMNGGRITEAGTHDELLTANGLCATLWKAWTSTST